MSMKIETAILFAAGFGKRLGDITKNIPKPLITIGGKTLLSYCLDSLCAYPLKRIIINIHHLSDLVEREVQKYIDTNKPDVEIILIYEEQILETGGAIKNVSKHIIGSNIFTLNADSIISSDKNILHMMSDRWQNNLDFLMLVQDIKNAVGYHGNGDLDIIDGKVVFQDNSAYVYTGLQIMNSEIIIQHQEDVFSLSKFFLDQNYHKTAMINSGKWYHLTYPSDIFLINSIISPSGS